MGIVGDSLTYLSKPSIERSLDHTWSYNIQAIEGRNIRSMTGPASQMIHGPTGPPTSVVINLGTNDVLEGNRNWQSDWNKLLSVVSPVHCEVLFTLNDFIDAYRRPRGATAQEFNRLIDQDRAADPSRVHIIDWNAAVQANHRAIAAAQLRGGPLPAPLIRGDGVHPAAAGQEWIARHIASTLDDSCR